MSSKTVKFQLEDVDGEVHNYVSKLHNPSANLHMVMELVGAGSVPVARFLESNVGGLIEAFIDGGLEQIIAENIKTEDIVVDGEDGEQKFDFGSLDVSKLLDVIGDLDLASAAQDLRDGIRLMDSPKLIRALLVHTTRDGKPLRDDGHFDDAYTANWGELRSVLFKVIGENRFHHFIATFGN